MGWLCSGLPFPVTCLALLWAAGCGSLKVLQKPTCFSDYLTLSTCEWRLDQALDCSAALHLSYQLLSNPDPYEESHVCVPENSAATACVCDMGLRNLVVMDTYQLDLWAGKKLLWSYNFTPSLHVKPRAPVNLTFSTNVSSGWLLSWSNLYPPWNYLHNKLTYQVNVSSKSEPERVKVYNVTYKETTFHLEARDLTSGISYTARVRALAQLGGSIWSEWSPGATWENYYEQPLEQRLKLGVVIACFLVVLICLSCYCSVTRIKREWWDQIPNPACSPVVAIVLQDPQVSPWEKWPRGQQPGKRPHWKTCLTKLLPCLLEHGMKKDKDLLKVARNRPLHGPRKSTWCPMEISKTVLLPETISVVRCVELFEAPGKAEEEEEEEEEGEGTKYFCTSEESSEGEGSFGEGREGIAARLTERLLLGLLGAEEGAARAPTPPVPSAARAPACTAEALLVEDNPAYRSVGPLLGWAQSPGEPAPDAPRAASLGEGDPEGPGGAPPTEPPSWEQLLRLRVLQHGAAPAGPCAGYRAFAQAAEPEAGYTASPGPHPDGAACSGLTGAGASSGAGGYRPFQDLAAGPLFPLGLDVEPPRSPAAGLGPGVTEDEQKPPRPPQQAAEPVGDDLGSGGVYSALTCHLCGHLKQCHGQEEPGQAQVAPGPGCGCCCGDRALPPGPPPAQRSPAGPSVSKEAKTAAPSGAHSSSQAWKGPGLGPPGRPSARVS
ncbi:interleukin-4 receptor subunit alpha [Heterocephalus glaber]|uniref:Interleukin-4 receptor subunit alpha n=1 Tax=Heterocephalus glaber TaxID=10181 RepID=A0AAX6PNU0_HETGA|nr:interleukin-4 receptor subunit alpha [Heterocephalus glaber]XP_004856052.1 interleukin-4 receptor subunit alpha [Heterocephalus glaber]